MFTVRKVLVAAALVVGITTSVVADPSFVAAAAPTTYTVRAGDSLYGIAARTGVAIDALLAANRMTLRSVITPGMVLTVPGTAAPTTTVPTPTTTTPARPQPTPTTPARTYTVVAGDSFYRIAARLGVSIDALLSANRMTRTSVIRPGMQLVAPAGAKLPAAAPATPAPSTTAPSTTGPTTTAPAGAAAYVVRSGDSLYRIADRLGVTLQALLDANRIQKTSVIYPGMRLTVPAGGHLPTETPTATPVTPASGTPGTSSRVQKVLDFAMAQLGKPYVFNMAGPDSFDCSGLTMAAYAEIGISLPHYSGAQVVYGRAVDWRTEAIRPGDLVFLERTIGSGAINHVAIATGATTWVHAPRTGDVVRTGAISFSRVVAVRRLVND